MITLIKFFVKKYAIVRNSHLCSDNRSAFSLEKLIFFKTFLGEYFIF